MFFEVDGEELECVRDTLGEVLDDLDSDLVLAGLAFYAVKVIHNNYETKYQHSIAEFFSALVIETIEKAQHATKTAN